MTRGQIEAKISEAVTRFENDYMGRGPKQIKTTIVQDMIIIRLIGFLSPSEQSLANDLQGIELLKKVRVSLFEHSKGYLIEEIKNVIDVGITSTHSDVSTRTGEKIILFTVAGNLEEKLGK